MNLSSKRPWFVAWKEARWLKEIPWRHQTRTVQWVAKALLWTPSLGKLREPGDGFVCQPRKNFQKGSGKGSRIAGIIPFVQDWFTGSWSQGRMAHLQDQNDRDTSLSKGWWKRGFHFIPCSPSLWFQTSYKKVVFFHETSTFQNLIQFNLTFIYSSSFQGMHILHFDSCVNLPTRNLVAIYIVIFSCLTLNIYLCFHLLWEESHFPEICLFDLSFQSSGPWFD